MSQYEIIDIFRAAGRDVNKELYLFIPKSFQDISYIRSGRNINIS